MKVAELFAELGLKFDQAAFNSADKQLRGLGASTEKLAGFAKKAGVAILGYLAFDKVTSTIEATATAADNLAGTVDRIGVSAEALQTFGHAAEFANSSSEAAYKGLTKLAIAVGGIKAGDPASEALKKLGIASDNAALKSKDVEALLPAIADGMAKLPTSAERADIALQLFGKAGIELVPALMGGAEGLKAARAELDAFGGAVPIDEVRKIAAVGDDFNRAKKSLTLVTAALVRSFTPALTQMAKWAIAGGKGLAKVFASIKANATIVLVALGSIAGAFAVVKLQAAFATMGVAGFGATSVKAALLSAAAWAKSALAFSMLVLKVAAVVLILQDLYVWIKGGDSVLKDLYYSARYWLAEKFTQVFTEAPSVIRIAFEKVFAWISEKILWLRNKLIQFERAIMEKLGLGPKAGEAWGLTEFEESEQEQKRTERAAKTQRALADFANKKVLQANAPSAQPRREFLSPAGLGPTVEAPMVFHITGGADPQATAAAIGDVVSQKLDATARKIKAGARK